jgi:hypothetical protein
LKVPEIELPDGSIAKFPDTMSDAEVKAVLRKRFPPPRPAALAPGERELRPNGAKIVFDEEFEHFAVYDSDGRFHGFRRTLGAAIDLADSIKPPPAPRRQPEEPQPEEPSSPLAAERQIVADVERSICRQESRERSERLAERRQRRYRNRGRWVATKSTRM